MEFVAERVTPILIFGGVWIAAGLLLLALAGVWRLGRSWKLRRWPGRLATVLLLLLAVVSGLGLYLLLGPLSSQLAEGRAVYARIGQEAPDLAFRQVSDDAPRRLRDLRGQVVLLNMWATWCPPCREEMPALDKLQKEHGDRGLVVVTVSDEDRQTLQKYVADYPLSTLYVYDPAIAQKLGFYGRPLSLVIDREGKVREAVIGSRSYETFERKVMPLLTPS